MLLRHRWFLISLLLLGLVLQGCTTNAMAGANNPHPTMTVHASSPLPTLRSSATASPSPSPMPSPTHTPGAIASPSLPSAATPSATPTPLACWSKGGRILKGSLTLRTLRTPLLFRIYLPPCYDQEPKRRYPVLYLFHGQSYNDDQWDRLGVDETADRLIAAGEIPPLIVVMPFDRYGGQPTDTSFSQAIVEILLPYVDQLYRTIPNRQHRAVGGLSRGAGWATHFGISQWKLFGALGAHSPAIFHTDAQSMRTWLDAIPSTLYPRIYVDIGDRDRPEITQSALWFEALLNQYEIPHEWHLFTGYHAEEYWQTHMEKYLRWYTANW